MLAKSDQLLAREKLCAVLRSGKYHQCHKRWCEGNYDMQGDVTHLTAVCAVSAILLENGVSKCELVSYPSSAASRYEDYLQKHYGFRQNGLRDMAHDNDAGMTFAEIADRIEAGAYC